MKVIVEKLVINVILKKKNVDSCLIKVNMGLLKIVILLIFV